MKADLIVQNARIVAQTGVFVGWLAVQDGRIAALGEGPAPGPAKNVLDGKGQVLLPGAIDTHPHFFDPGAEWREDLRCGTQAAASGGYTTILDMPNTSPPVKDEATWQLKAGRAQQNSLIDFALWGSAMPSNLDELGRLAELGCVGYKAFTLDAGPDFDWSDEYGQLREMQAVAALGGIFGAHAENPALVNGFSGAHAGEEWSLAVHDASRPWQAELTAINTLLLYARLTGCRLHICHLSIPEGAALIAQAKKQGVDVTAETCAHYLTLNYEDNAALGAFAKINPPLRSRARMEKLWEYVMDGGIDYLGTDHAPYLEEEKLPPEGGRAAACGAPEIDLAIPLLFEEGVLDRGMDLQRFAAFTSTNAARRFGLYPRKGTLAVGADADFILLDPNSPWTFSRKNSFSKSKAARFGHEGRTLRCRVTLTCLRGVPVYANGRILQQPGFGRLVRPQGGDRP